MPSNIVDPQKASDSLDEEIQSLEDKDSELPEKYRGKTAPEIAKMHMEAEKLASRQGQTVGEQRKVIDEFIKLQLSGDKTTQTKEAPKPLTTDALFENPDKAVRDAVDSTVGAKVKALEDTLTQVTRQSQQQAFQAKHTGVADTLNDPSFQAWVQASPARMRLAYQWDQFDFSSGDDLLSLWKDHQDVSDLKAKRESATREREQNLKAAKTEGGSSGGGEHSPKKRYSRLEISSLMTKARAGDKDARKIVDDPAWQENIRKAYAEGRVA